MIRRARWSLFAAVSGLLACGAATVSGCSGDDSSTGGNDAAVDATTTDAHADVQPGVDSNAPDTSTPDTSTPDAQGDAADAGACALAFDAAALDDAAVQTGLDLVKSFGCANCHQSTPADAGIVLSGRNTTLKDGGDIYPPNLTPDPSTGLGCWTDTQITNAILNGIDDKGAALCVMPKFATKGMDAGAAEAIATFLHSLPAVKNQVPNTVCPVIDGGSDAGDAGADAGDAADAHD